MYNKYLRILLAIIVVVIIMCILVSGIGCIALNKKVKNTDTSINSELFELCDYLYDVQQNDAIYDTYSLLFQDKNPFEFFEELGMNKDEITTYITKWGAKYVIASSNVNQKNDALSDACNLLLELYNYDSDLIIEFIQSLEVGIHDNNGMVTNLFESFELKKFLDVFGDSVEESDIPLPSKQPCYDFINGQYASIGDFKSAYIFSWKANGIESFEPIEKVGTFDIWGYVFRYTIIAICTVFIVLSIVLIIKKKKIFISLICIFSSIAILAVSFYTADIKKPDINNTIDNCIDTINTQYLPIDNSVYSVYGFDCDEYYGTVSISFEDSEKKQEEFIKNIDGEFEPLYSSVSCVRDNYNLPNCVVGIATVYIKNIRISIKYIYKSQSNFGPIKYITFTQYFSKPTIDLEEIIENIDTESISIIQKE